jgi:ketosteroid isomerase-like protein
MDTQPEAIPEEDGVSEENKALVRRLVDEFINGGRLDLLEELFAPELVGPIRQADTSFRAAFPDWREEIVDLVAEGDKVAARFRCSGTFQGEFMGAAPNGRRQEVDEVYFLRVRDGRIVEYWGLEDNLTRLRQLDVLS